MASAREQGYQIIAVELTAGAQALHEAELEGDCAILLGSEEHGLTRRALAAADKEVFIPMLGKGASLNVHVAGALVAYEIRLGSLA